MTVKIVSQEVETVLIVKIVEDTDNQKSIGYNGKYVQGSPSGGGHVPPGGDASRMTTTN